MLNNFDYLIDSDFFVGMFLSKDALFESVKEIFFDLKARDKRTATTNWVVAETATVLSSKASQVAAVNFLKMIDEGAIPVLQITPDLEQETRRIFQGQLTKRTSMVDCSNVAIARHYSIPDLLSFDEFYIRFGYKILKVVKQKKS